MVFLIFQSIFSVVTNSFLNAIQCLYSQPSRSISNLLYRTSTHNLANRRIKSQLTHNLQFPTTSISTPSTNTSPQPLALIIGFCGLDFDRYMKTASVDSVSVEGVLEEILYKLNLISSKCFGHLRNSQWSRALVIDREISVTGQVVSVHLNIPTEYPQVSTSLTPQPSGFSSVFQLPPSSHPLVHLINSHIPKRPLLRVLDICPVTKSFRASRHATCFTYEYLLPISVFDVLVDGGLCGSSHREHINYTKDSADVDAMSTSDSVSVSTNQLNVSNNNNNNSNNNNNNNLTDDLIKITRANPSKQRRMRRVKVDCQNLCDALKLLEGRHDHQLMCPSDNQVGYTKYLARWMAACGNEKDLKAIDDDGDAVAANKMGSVLGAEVVDNNNTNKSAEGKYLERRVSLLADQRRGLASSRSSVGAAYQRSKSTPFDNTCMPSNSSYTKLSQKMNTIYWTSCRAVNVSSNQSSSQSSNNLSNVYRHSDESNALSPLREQGLFPASNHSNQWLKISLISDINSDFHIRRLIGLAISVATGLISSNSISVCFNIVDLHLADINNNPTSKSVGSCPIPSPKNHTSSSSRVVASLLPLNKHYTLFPSAFKNLNASLPIVIPSAPPCGLVVKSIGYPSSSPVPLSTSNSSSGGRLSDGKNTLLLLKSRESIGRRNSSDVVSWDVGEIGVSRGDLPFGVTEIACVNEQVKKEFEMEVFDLIAQNEKKTKVFEKWLSALHQTLPLLSNPYCRRGSFSKDSTIGASNENKRRDSGANSEILPSSVDDDDEDDDCLPDDEKSRSSLLSPRPERVEKELIKDEESSNFKLFRMNTPTELEIENVQLFRIGSPTRTLQNCKSDLLTECADDDGNSSYDLSVQEQELDFWENPEKQSELSFTDSKGGLVTEGSGNICCAEDKSYRNLTTSLSGRVRNLDLCGGLTTLACQKVELEFLRSEGWSNIILDAPDIWLWMQQETNVRSKRKKQKNSLQN